MNCHDVRQHWSLYHDSEGDAELHFQISEHLGICSECAGWYERQSRLESVLIEKLRSSSRSPQLWHRTLRRAGLSAPARRWWWVAGAAAAAAAFVIAALLVPSLRPRTAGPDLSSHSVNWHERLQTGEETLQFRSASDLEVEQYLRARVAFPVRCPPRKDAGFAVQGAGVCRLAGEPAAYLAGHVGDSPVSIFVLPRDSLGSFPRQRDLLSGGSTHRRQLGGLQVVMAAIDRNAVVVVGPTDPERLERVLRAYGTYPHLH